MSAPYPALLSVPCPPRLVHGSRCTDCRVRVAVAAAALSVAVASAMVGAVVAANPSELPRPVPTLSGFRLQMRLAPIPTTPAVPEVPRRS